MADWVVDNATGRPQAAIPMSIPVRLTDNAMCTDPVGQTDKPYCYADFDGSGTADFCADSIQLTIDTPTGTQDVDMCITEDGRLMRGNTASTRARLGLHEYSTTAPYVFGGEDNSAFFESIDSAWFTMSYEENKGLGECDDEDATKLDMGKNVWYHTFDMFNPELVSQGLMLNQPSVYPDDFSDPLGVLTPDDSFGYNFFQITEDPIYETLTGNYLDSTLYQTEISRRPSPITQDFYLVGETGTVGFQLWKQGIIRRGGPADIMGRGFRIDFSSFVSTTDNPYDYTNLDCDVWAFDDGTNPRYVKGFCADPADNLSANTVVLGETCSDAATCLEAFPFNDYFDDLAGGTAIPKIYEWGQTGPGYGVDPATLVGTDINADDTNLNDSVWANPYDVAKGHRGFLNGDMLMIMYAWSPNWMANTVGHDNYNLYNRRSFDGGLTWSTTPSEYGGDGTTTCEWMGPAGSDTEFPICTTYGAGDFEQTRNVSQLVGTRETILDPRYTPAPPAISIASMTSRLPDGWFNYDDAMVTDDDIRNPSLYYMVYETGDNTTVAVGEAEPLDLYYSRAINWGDDYQIWADEGQLSECLPGAEDTELAGFCNEFEPLEGSQFSESGEASVSTNPSGRFFYSVWNQIDFGVDGLSEDSDTWFRRVLYWFTPAYTIPPFEFPGQPEPPPPPENVAPTISIDDPANGAEFYESNEITFNAFADDTDDGDLSDFIVWEDNGTPLGTGATLTETLDVGTHLITATVTDSGDLSASAQVTITVLEGTPPPPPPVETVTMASLVGSSSTKNKVKWLATVEMTIDPALAGAEVTGTWSEGGSFTCTTDGLGQCSVSLIVSIKIDSIVLTIQNIELAGYEYDPSGVVSVIIDKP